MGMPIKSYDILKLLAQPSERSAGSVEKRLQDVLAQFRLQAVVLHDPARHADLDRVLSREFGILDDITGSKLLFFALVEADESWIAEARQRHYFTKVEKMLKISYARAEPTPTVDSELTAVSSAVRLHIDPGELPCILVFQGGSDTFCWFRTDAWKIERQLQSLALAAGNMDPSDTASRRDLKQYLSKYVRSDDITDESLVTEDTSVADQLALSVITSERRYPAVRSAIELEKNKLQQMLAQSIHDRDAPAIFKSAFLLGMLVAMRDGGTTDVTMDYWPWPWPPREQWELQAGASLAAAIKLRHRPDIEILAPAVICYGMSFEAEINASIVQGLREKKGALMPEYFARYQPNLEIRVRVRGDGGDERPVDLNAQRRGAWFPPGLGESEMVARETGSEGFPFSATQWEILLEKWAVIRRKRNLAAHLSMDHPVSEEDVNACHDAFLNLGRDRVFDELFKLKARLRGSI